MLTKKYEAFRQDVKRRLAGWRGRKITETDVNNLAVAITADHSQDMPERVYCRDGFGLVNQLDNDHYQLFGFQVNSFGAGVFSPNVNRFVAPLLLDVEVRARRRCEPRTIEKTPFAITESYLADKFLGSMTADICNRDRFHAHTRNVLLASLGRGSCYHHFVYKLTYLNYVCHHVAEAAEYALGALGIFWRTGQDLCFMSASSHFNESKEKLLIEIIDDFAGERMRSYLEVPHYVKLMEDHAKFKEEFDTLLLEVTCRGETESFYLPVGYQKVAGKRRGAGINVVTTQHILQHLLKDYYRRENAFAVSTTFETLEYLSRGFIARQEGRVEEGEAFLGKMTTCLGYYPKRDYDEFWRQKAADYDAFEDEFTETMFFRPPVLE